MFRARGHATRLQQELRDRQADADAAVAENTQLVDELEAQAERAEVTLHSIADAVITTNAHGIIDYLNPVAERLTGWTTLEAIGVGVAEVLQVASETTGEPIENPALRCLREGRSIASTATSCVVRRDDKQFSIDDSVSPVRDFDGVVTGTVVTFRDCTSTRAMAQQLTWHTKHDALTGLANRQEFQALVGQALDNARTQELSHVMLYMDLDQFKVVNDTCGHVAGDELLKQLTTLLGGEIREIDTVARLGGDEFGIILYGCTLADGRGVAEKLRECVRNFRFVWQATSFELGASIGLVAIDKQSRGVAALLSAADMACQVAKEQGRNRVYAYSDADEGVAHQRRGEMQWVSRITRALAEDRFTLYCQSIIPTTGTDDLFNHVEILVRMLDNNGKIIPPGAFIPAAERYNLMGDIDRWVIRNVFKRYQGRLSADGEKPPMCSINLSGPSMGDESMLRLIQSLFEQYDVDPQCICFEITETAAVQNLTIANKFISELSNLGCRFALDDFGAGLSSFAYLKNLPVDYLKIDGGFVKDMVNDPMARAIVDACSAIGKAMGIETIAEFVEDDATLQALESIGVDYAQGYGINKPTPLEDILKTFAQHAA